MLIARAFLSVPYPILPDTLAIKARNGSKFARLEILQTPLAVCAARFRPVTVFEIVKPHLAKGFGRNMLAWSAEPAPDPERVSLSAA